MLDGVEAHDIRKEAINRHMNRLRGMLFTLIEGCVPVGQQEAVKRSIKAHTQYAWRGLLIDAGYSADWHKDEQTVDAVESVESAAENVESGEKQNV